MITALGIVPAWEEKMNAPRWVVFLVGSLFFMAGMWILLQAIVGEAAATAFGTVVGLTFFIGLAAVGHWMAFGGGDRNDCGGGISALGFGFSSGASDFECRAAFGYGAILMDFILLRGIAWQLAQRTPESRSVRAFEKAAEWGIGLLLLPLVLLALVLTKGTDGVTRLVSKLRSNQNKQD